MVGEAVKWLRTSDEMGIPGWLWVLFWIAIAFLALTLAAEPMAMLLGW